MSNIQLIEDLCGVIDVFCTALRRLARKLEEINALDDEDRKSIEEANLLYSKAIGSGELQDLLPGNDPE